MLILDFLRSKPNNLHADSFPQLSTGGHSPSFSQSLSKLDEIKKDALEGTSSDSSSRNLRPGCACLLSPSDHFSDGNFSSGSESSSTEKASLKPPPASPSVLSYSPKKSPITLYESEINLTRRKGTFFELEYVEHLFHQFYEVLDVGRDQILIMEASEGPIGTITSTTSQVICAYGRNQAGIIYKGMLSTSAGGLSENMLATLHVAMIKKGCLSSSIELVIIGGSFSPTPSRSEPMNKEMHFLKMIQRYNIKKAILHIPNTPEELLHIIMSTNNIFFSHAPLYEIDIKDAGDPLNSSFYFFSQRVQKQLKDFKLQEKEKRYLARVEERRRIFQKSCNSSDTPPSSGHLNEKCYHS